MARAEGRVARRPLSGVVLAGGPSSRMGADKALLDVGGEPLVLRAVRTLAALCEDVVVASGDGRRLAGLGVAQVADVEGGAGPLAGIIAGLESATHQLVAVLAVDMPHANAAVFRLLADRWSGEPAVVPVVDGHEQPLHAIWTRDAAVPLRDLLAAGQLSARSAAVALGAAIVGPDVWGRADPTGRFATNLNRPEDLLP
jgi:molybdenum cofactor guanylyltransferase